MLNGLGTEKKVIPPAPVTLPKISLPPDNVELEIQEATARVAEQRTIRQGRDTWENVKRGSTFEGWLAIGRALQVGRGVALRATGSTMTNGRPYTLALHEWCNAHGFKGMDKQTRYTAIELVENADAITVWRASLPEHRRKRLVQAASNLRQWRRSLVPRMETNDVKAEARRFTIVLQAEPHIDAVRNLRIALKVLKRRYGLRVVTIREEP